MSEPVVAEGCYAAPPCIIHPSKGQNADHARLAIWALGRELDAEIFPASDGWRSDCGDGRREKPKPIPIRFCGVIQPADAGDFQVQTLKEGESHEGRMCLHVDPEQPENKAVAAQYPDLFPEGVLFLSGPDDECCGRVGNSDIIKYAGCRWKILSACRNPEGECEKGGVHRFILGLYRDRDGERDALPSDQERYCWNESE